MRKKEEKLISLKKSNKLGTILIVLFSIIDKATSENKIIIDDKTVSIIKKEESEIYDFGGVDYKILKNRILMDFINNPNSEYIHLNDNESKLFRACSHAAYYFETEHNLAANSENGIKFIKFHKKFIDNE